MLVMQHQVVIKATAYDGEVRRDYMWPTNKFEDLLHYLQEVQLRDALVRCRFLILSSA